MSEKSRSMPTMDFDALARATHHGRQAAALFRQAAQLKLEGKVPDV